MSRRDQDLEGLNVDKIIAIVSNYCSLSPNYIKDQIYNYWKDEERNASLTPFNREHYAAEYIFSIPDIIPDQVSFEFPNSCFRGIDLPYWFDWNNSNKKKVFAIGLAAQRSKENWAEYQKGYFGQNTWKSHKNLNLSNSVILHSAWGANTTFAGHQMNNTLFRSLLDSGAISLYLTDYFKVFTKINNSPIHKIRSY